jgi:hypothetical protein
MSGDKVQRSHVEKTPTPPPKVTPIGPIDPRIESRLAALERRVEIAERRLMDRKPEPAAPPTPGPSID